MKRKLQMIGVIMGLMTVFCSSVTLIKAQGPQAFNYQTVVRNSDGEPIQNQAVAFRISIVQDSPGGTIVYQERQIKTTNDFGLATLEIGRGTVLTGTFSTIGWSAGQMYLKIEVDPNGSISYLDMGTMQLLSVPYALHAQSSSSTSDVNWAKTGSNIYCTNTGNVGIGTGVPKGKLSISPYQGGTAGSLVSTYTHQLVLGGSYDIGANLTGVKLWIGDYNNDGTDVYPIYCEDENNKVDFWIKSRTNQTTGLPTMFLDGRFGIGTTVPANSRLHLEGSSSFDATIRLNNTGTNGTDFFMSSTSDTWSVGGKKFVMGHGIPQSSNIDLSLNDAGYLGLGTIAPEGLLHLNSDGDASLIIEADAGNNSGTENYNPRIELRQDEKQVMGAFGFIGSNNAIYLNSIANSLYMVNEFDAPIHFGTDSTIRMTLSRLGNLGLGTTSPLGKLSVESGSGYGYNFNEGKGIVIKDGESNTGSDFEIQDPNGNVNLIVTDAGRLGIETANPTHLLSVNGTILSKEVIVNTEWSDFVFEEDYDLMPLQKLELYIRCNKHLPEIPSATDVETNGISLGNMEAKLLQKIEELTLYLIDLNQKVINLQTENMQLKKQAIEITK